MNASPVFGCLRNPSMVDYPDRPAAVFFTAGCNFSCGFCHNAELMGRLRPGMTWAALQEHCRRFTDDWVSAAVITGGEPTLAPGLPELIAFFKKRGWAVKLDTNGSQPAMLETCLPQVDYVAMDIKTRLEGYPELTGWTDTGALRESIRLIMERAADYEFRTTLIEGVHGEAELTAMAGLIAGARRFVLQPFIPSDNLPSPRFRAGRRTPPQMLETAAAIFRTQLGQVTIRGT